MENASVQRGLFFTFRLFSLIRPGLRPVHLKRRGRLPPAGEHSSGPGLNFQGSPPHPPPAGGTLSKQERAGIPSGGGFPYLHLGEGAAAAADEGRYQVGSACRPTPVRAFGPDALSKKRVFSKFPERNPLLLGTLMVEYPRWLWPA